MKLKNTLILLAVALGIVGYIQFFEKSQPSSQEAADLAGRVVQFERDKIDAITIKNPERTIELHKTKDGLWLMEKPLKDHADAMAVNQLFTTAEALRSEALASDGKGATKDQLKEFGLATSCSIFSTRASTPSPSRSTLPPIKPRRATSSSPAPAAPRS